MSGAIGAGLFLLTVAAFFRPPLLPDIGRDLRMSALGLGLLGSIFALGRLAADFPAGRMSDRVRSGPMMSISGVLVAVGSVMLATAPNAAVAYASLFVLGLGSTWALTTGMAHFAKAPRARRGMALSAFAGALLVGQSVGPAFGGLLGASIGWRWAIGVAAMLGAVAAIGFLWVRTSLSVSGTAARAEGGEVIPVPAVVLAFIYLLPALQFTLGGALLQTLVPIVADAELGMGPGVVGVALGLGGLSRLVAAFVAGQVTDRMSRKLALVPGQVIQALGVAVFLIWSSRVALFASIILVSLGSVGVNVGATILADLSEGGGLGKRLGAFRFTGDAAFMVGPVLSGWLYEVSGRVLATLPLLLFSLVVTVGAWAFVPETATAEHSA